MPIYIGDDLTDEDAFEALNGSGVTIVVTDAMRPTSARFSLKSVAQVYSFLERLLARYEPPVRSHS
jgi:trehalose-phosphatase